MGKVIKLSVLLKLRRTWKGKKVVFTNGVFDLLHFGHVRLLQDCRKLGDVLIVGVNSDRSVRRLKGAGRPLVPFHDRSRILAALAAVDYVVSFAEDTPLELIKKIKPDILAKGADYRLTEIVGAKEVRGWKGRVKRVRLLTGRSTSGLIARIVRDFGTQSFT